MKPKNLAMLVLGIYLILAGLRNLLGIAYSYRAFNTLMDVLAVASGALILWAMVSSKSA
jgi:uncharacterized membrane protein HdeD (DUF308 family)